MIPVPPGRLAGSGKKRLLGNCLIGALLIWLRHGGRIRKERGGIHFYVTLPNGRDREFSVFRDILPYPFNYLCYIGQCQYRRKVEITYQDYLETQDRN